MPSTTVKQGSDFYSPQTGQKVGTVQYDPNTGKPLAAGASATFNPFPMENGSPVISTDFLSRNGTTPQLAQGIPNVTPQQFVAGLSPLQPTQTQPTSATSVSGTTANVNSAEQGRSALVRRLGQAQQQLLGQGQEQLRLEQQAQIPQSVKELNALNEQIAGKKAAFDQAAAEYASMPIGVERQTGKIAQIQRNAAVELGGLSALALAKQGSIDAAKAEVDRTLKMEFDPIKQEIENTKMFLDLNYQDLDRADKKQADALRVQLAREERAANAFESRKTSALNAALESGDDAAYKSILGASSSSALASAVASIASKQTGVPTKTAEAIGESKVGQKVNATIDLTNSLAAYRTMYKKYADAGNLVSIEAQRNLATLKGDLEQKYSVANGQGAVQTGDRESYNKIIRGGILFPEQALSSMDTLISSMENTTNNDIKYLDSTYQGYGTAFFAPQLSKVQQSATDPAEKLKSLYTDEKLASQIDQAIANFPSYSPAEILQLIGQ